MRSSEFRAVGIAMLRSAEIEADEDHNLTRPVLQLDFAQVDAASAYIKEEIFSSIG